MASSSPEEEVPASLCQACSFRPSPPARPIFPNLQHQHPMSPIITRRPLRRLFFWGRTNRIHNDPSIGGQTIATFSRLSQPSAQSVEFTAAATLRSSASPAAGVHLLQAIDAVCGPKCAPPLGQSPLWDPILQWVPHPVAAVLECEPMQMASLRLGRWICLLI